MLMVLLVLTALTIGAASFHSQSADNLLTSHSLNAYQMAAARAEQGSQMALAMVRSGILKPNTLVGTCSDTDPFTTCTTFLGGTSTLVDNGRAMPPREGGGLQYMYMIYRPVMTGDPTKTPSDLYTIRAVGYFGYALNSPNLFVSEVETQFNLGFGVSSSCAGGDDYGC
jgi:hypothetical protein